MSNIIILTSASQYPYHTSIAEMIQTVLHKHNVCRLDIDASKYDHQYLAEINRLSPDVLITLDLAGFRFRTQSGESALNMLYTKNLNLIWGNKPEYAPLLSKKISLSMIFYDATGIDNRLTDHYPNLLYYKVLGELTDADGFASIWNDFTQEVLLP